MRGLLGRAVGLLPGRPAELEWSGVRGVKFGGTGGRTPEEARSKLGIVNIADYGFLGLKNADQAIAATTETVVSFSDAITGGFDSGADFGSNVWVPGKSGKMRMGCAITFTSAVSGTEFFFTFKKNNSLYRGGSGGVVQQSTAYSLDDGVTTYVSSAYAEWIDDANGTTDNFRIVIYASAAGKVRFSAPATPFGSAQGNASYFLGHPVS